MRHHTPLIISFFVACWAICAVINLCYAQITFEKTYGGDSLDLGFCVRQTQDTGYIIAGETESYGAGQSDVYLLKADSLGNTLWAKVYGGAFSECAKSVQQTQDGGYIIAGHTRSFGAGDADVYLIKTDSAGDSVWTRTYGGTSNDYGESVEQTPDGGYIITGSTYSFGAGEYDVYLIKTDSLGNIDWTGTYGGTQSEYGYSVSQAFAEEYAIVGISYSFGAGMGDVYFVKTDSLGNALWTLTYGDSLPNGGRSVQQTIDGGYIIAGGTMPFLGSPADIHLIKTDSSGVVVWERDYGGSGDEYCGSIRQTSDGGYIITGQTESFGTGPSDAFLVKIDTAGYTLWERTYGGNLDDGTFCVQRTVDGGYICAGGTNSFGAGNGDVYLIKTDENGLTGVEEERPAPEVHVSDIDLLQNTPNPFVRSTLISYSLPHISEVTLSIYNVTGRLVETLVSETQQPGIHQICWEREDNPSGVYFYQLKAGEFVETRKMVVVD